MTNACTFVGFDSAWVDNPSSPGAICSIKFDAGFSGFRPPRLAGFEAALGFIDDLREPDMPLLLALDQPTIVPNVTGMRPVEKVAASLISWMGGGVQPANRSKLAMFGPDAPLWRFVGKLSAEEHPERARTASTGLHLIEVFPALALASLNPAFFVRLKGPRYNPARRKTFRHGDWEAVIGAAVEEAQRLSCSALVDWLADHGKNEHPRKADQDLLDAALCLLIAIRWRLAPRDESIVLGDLRTGYMVAPVSPQVFVRIESEASARGVPVNRCDVPACIDAVPLARSGSRKD